MSGPASNETSDDTAQLARRIEYLENRIHQLEAEAHALRDQLRLAQHEGVASKMDSLNRLTHGIAHDLNNLLTPIIACSHLIKEERGVNALPGVIENADQMIESGEQLIAVTRKLHSLYPKAPKRFQASDLNAEVNAAADAARPALDGKATLSLALDPGVGMVQSETDAIGKIVRELCANAAEAMPCGGDISIRTSRGGMEGGADAGDFAILTVRDQGTGMKPEILEHIYEPYHTTKEPSRGKGFGLAFVYGNVLRCGATIFCETEPGKGTEFRIYFRKS